MSTYVFDQGWEKERGRLAGIETLFNDYSTWRLADLGVSAGWQCLEVGFGAGGLALWLADRVGSTGRVVAVDLDPRFLDVRSSLNRWSAPVWSPPATLRLSAPRYRIDPSITRRPSWSQLGASAQLRDHTKVEQALGICHDLGSRSGELRYQPRWPCPAEMAGIEPTA